MSEFIDKWKKKLQGLLKNRLFRLFLISLTISISFLSFQSLTAEEDTSKEIDFTEAISLIEENKIETITIHQSSYTMTLEDSKEQVYSSVYAKGYEEKLIDSISESNATLTIDPIKADNFVKNLLLSIAPVLIIITFLIFALGGLSNISKKDSATNTTGVKLSDVAGVEEAIDEIKEVVEYLKDPEPYKRLTAKAPNGILLVGPPGTGKTLIARAIAGEAKVPFFQTTGADFVEMFAGVGPKRVRSLFKNAKKHGKAVIFIDEIDAIGRTRNQGRIDSVSREMDSTLTTLLTEIDGFEKHNIIVIGATNLQDSLDPALSRRLHKVINVPLPDSGGREKILELHAKDRPFNKDINWSNVAKQTTGLSGAQLALVVDEACLIATKRKAVDVSENDLIDAAVTLHVGKERKSAVLTDFDKEVTAWHEAGHTIVAKALADAMDPSYVTIVPRGESGGHTRFDMSENNYFTKAQIKAQLAAALGGRAAEIIAFGYEGFTQGAGSDIKVATHMATDYVTKYGMGSTTIFIDKNTLDLGTNISDKVYVEVTILLDEALNLALRTLKANNKTLKKLKEELVTEETIKGEELNSILSEVKISKLKD